MSDQKFACADSRTIWADEQAKAAAELHPKPSTAARTWLDAMKSKAAVACKVLAEATLLWPDASQLRGEIRRPTTRGERRALAQAAAQRRRGRRAIKKDVERMQRQTHTWAKIGDTRRCISCMRWEAAGIAACDGQGLAQWRSMIDMAKQHGHELQEGELYDQEARILPPTAAPAIQRWEGGLPMVICTHCGAWATAGGRPQRLLTACARLTLCGKAALERVASGLHPKSGRLPPRCSIQRNRVDGSQPLFLAL